MHPAPALSPPPSRDELILSLGPQVLYIANRMYRDIPGFFDREDVITEAWIGAIHAVDRFNPNHNAKLGAFAECHIKGHILDFFRRVDFVGRRERGRIKARETVQPTVGELREDTPTEDPTATRLITEFETGHDVGAIMRRATLTERERESLGRYSDLPLTHFAKKWKVHESRVSQICTGAVKKLREVVA